MTEPATPHSASTASNVRAVHRRHMARLGTLTSIGSRGLGLVLLLLGVRLTVSYLGAERFGVWATFASMAAMLSLLDLGIGNALVNRVAHASTEGNSSKLRQVITGGLGLLLIVSGAGIVVLITLAVLLPWATLFKVHGVLPSAETQHAALVFALLLGVNLASSGSLRVLVGQQRSFEANLLSAASTLAACVSLWIAARLHAGVPVLLSVTFGIQSLGGLAAAWLLIRRAQFHPASARIAVAVERSHLLKTGSLFLLLQGGTMLGWGSDNVLLAAIRGPVDVAVYVVAQRMFQLASQPFAMLNAPLWASYADAHARGDAAFVRTTLRTSVCVSLLGSTLVCMLLCLFGAAIVRMWTRGAIVVSTPILVLLAIWTVIEVGGNAFGVYLNGCSIVREQVAVVLLFCALVLPLKLWLGSAFGVEGLIVAAIAAYVTVVVGLYGFVFRNRVLRPLKA